RAASHPVSRLAAGAVDVGDRAVGAANRPARMRAARPRSMYRSSPSRSSCADRPGDPMPDTPPPFDLLIRGGTVVDGTRAPRFDADVGIAGGRIAAIGALADHPAQRTLEAAGRIVAPGFIDSH